MPNVKKAYDQYHGNGFEVVGISNDFSSDAVKKFLAKNPGYSWTILFDEKAAKDQEWHPITTGFGIDAIPVMMIIDKKGVCRSVTARKTWTRDPQTSRRVIKAAAFRSRL